MDENAQSLESLKEVATIAAGHTATALSSFIGHEVAVAVPSATVINLEKVTEKLGPTAQISSLTLVKIKGDVQGLLLFSLDPVDAATVAATIITTQTGGNSYADFDQSVLREMVNIVGGAALGALGDFLGMQLLQSVPAGAIDMLGATLDPVIAELGSEFQKVLALQEVFTIPDRGASLKMLAVIDPPSTEKILAKLAEKVNTASNNHAPSN